MPNDVLIQANQMATTNEPIPPTRRTAHPFRATRLATKNVNNHPPMSTNQKRTVTPSVLDMGTS